MAILRTKEMKKLEAKELDKKLGELRLELAKERGNINIGASVGSPGRLKEIRRTIARILTEKNKKKEIEINAPLRPAKPAEPRGGKIKK